MQNRRRGKEREGKGRKRTSEGKGKQGKIRKKERKYTEGKGKKSSRRTMQTSPMLALRSELSASRAVKAASGIGGLSKKKKSGAGECGG